jgi:hypothetical protein
MNKHHYHHGNDESASRIGIAFFLNAGFTIIEFIGGWLTNSTAIMADAVHDLGDSLSIGSPWENGYNESFNGKLRDELLNREIVYDKKSSLTLS